MRLIADVTRCLFLFTVLLLLPAIVASQPNPQPPPTPPNPNQPPAVTLLGEDPLVLSRDCPFAEPGATTRRGLRSEPDSGVTAAKHKFAGVSSCNPIEAESASI